MKLGKAKHSEVEVVWHALNITPKGKNHKALPCKESYPGFSQIDGKHPF